MILNFFSLWILVVHILFLKNRCHSGIIEHFDIFKMAFKMEANYKLKNCVIWKKCLNPIFFLILLAMTLESS